MQARFSPSLCCWNTVMYYHHCAVLFDGRGGGSSRCGNGEKRRERKRCSSGTLSTVYGKAAAFSPPSYLSRQWKGTQGHGLDQEDHAYYPCNSKSNVFGATSLFHPINNVSVYLTFMNMLLFRLSKHRNSIVS